MVASRVGDSDLMLPNRRSRPPPHGISVLDPKSLDDKIDLGEFARRFRQPDPKLGILRLEGGDLGLERANAIGSRG